MRSLLLACLALCLPLAAFPQKTLDIHVQVSKQYRLSPDDLYHFPTIMNALDHAPDVPPGGRLYIHIAPGTYAERVYVSQYRPRTTLLGTGKDPSEVVITAAQNVKTAQSTFFSETMEVLADDFQADNLTVENTAGATGQALAVSVTADRAVFKRCRLLGYQDTLFAQSGRQYYTDSYISGAVDFIFGNAPAVFDHSEIHAIAGGYLTAQGRTSPTQPTGYVILNSKLTNESRPGARPVLFGRAWRPYARVILMHDEIAAGFDPKGWNNWDKDPAHIFYAEYQNRGPGASTSGRVPWLQTLTAAQARAYQPGNFLAGDDHWNPEAVAAGMP